MKLKEVIIVEGKHDSQRLKQFFDVDTIETNGMYLSKEKISLICSVHQKRGVILFLDPDSSGNRIRNKLKEAIPDAKHAFIDKKKCRTSKKVGIEHASKEDLEEALQHVVTDGNDIMESITFSEYLDLGFQGSKDAKHLRHYIGSLLFLGDCNAKTLFKRLNMYQISKEELKKLVEEYYE